ncbi:hypothetical protein L249_5455 [Ophiocordyceps polyrhachis-furcata BCC 54312]|uniref:Exocyst complex component Sec10-like alpha-helical bundle domain-containing protein n=1 Tax=Ophiocordyceps polyrhachis-furcata BCC 54312 TaxID=1330021 RepID=A0A367LHE6_9HYPO|nr:hypothetical protein L249_5455 [Ophiocordyceps polyrhachis-furcata BCC 54312]
MSLFWACGMLSTTRRLARSRAASLALLLLLLVTVSSSAAEIAAIPATADVAFALADIDGHPQTEPTYNSKFFPLVGGIVGRAPAGLSTLTKNRPTALNLQPGTTICYLVQRSDMFGDDVGGIPRPGRNPSQPNAEARPKTLYISSNTCLQPSADGKKADLPPQLTLSVSNSSETACRAQAAPPPKDGESKAFSEGAVTFSLNMTGDLFVGITAPNLSADFRGIYNFELGASPDDFLHKYGGDDRSELLWIDSDSSSAILATRNLTEDESEIKRIMNQALPYELYVSNDEAPSSAGLRHSFCGLRNTAQIRASQSSNSEPNSPVKTVITRRGPGGFPKQQFHFVSLNASAKYTGILVKKPREDSLAKRQDGAPDGSPGSVVFRSTEFETNTGSNCKIVTDLEFCDEIQYAVPGNDRRFNNTALGKAYDDYARKMYANFEKVMMQIPCEAPRTSLYSLARTCNDCKAAYKKWLCTVSMPRCEEFGSNSKFTLARNVGQAFPNGTKLPPELRQPLEQKPFSNSSRNKFIDEEIQPGPYKEILPCEELCYEVVQSCPAKIGFKCPRPEFPGFETSYGRRDEDPATVTCNFPGEPRTPMSGARALFANIRRAGGFALIATAVLARVKADHGRLDRSKPNVDMYRSRNGGGSRGAGILSALQATEMTDSRCKLPAGRCPCSNARWIDGANHWQEMLAAILDYLPVADQLRAARASRLLQEMVYDDTRWVARLKSMGCWDEREARRRFDESVRRRREAAAAATKANGSASPAPAITLFDASAEQRKQSSATEALRGGFETMSVGGAPKTTTTDADSYLSVLTTVRSIRGGARQEYGKVYGALAPFYYDIVKARSHAEPIAFKAFRDPERQAQMLANLRRFARSDWASGCVERENRLAAMTSVFEAAVVREFEQGYEFWDVDGRMRRYAHVLHTLNSARVGIDLFIHKHPIFHDRDLAAFNPVECLRGEAGGADISVEPSRRFFETLLAKVNEQADVVRRIFPESAAVFWELVDKVRGEILMEYVTPLLDECHERSIAVYLKAVSSLFEQTARFSRSLTPPSKTTEDKAKELLLKVFEPHLDLFFQDELEFFTKQAELEVSQWEKKLSEHDSSVESFYMSNINRSADKKDFLSSFKKVVMLPVAVLPSFPMGSPFAAASTPPPSSSASSAKAAALQQHAPSRPQTPSLHVPRANSPMPKAPTDELAAKAAIMASKLEGIKSLCSIEVALHLVHLAKASLGRVTPLVPLGGQMGGEARELCANIFVVMLRILGQRHVKTGFDTADDDDENTRDRGVAPLVTFIELVNVGDLISQMVDVFYEQQLVTPSIADKNDFLDAAGLAKKKFEQMLDESVAAGLNKGIDVLMDQVEFLQATTQLPTDYNPLLPSTTSTTTNSETTSTTTTPLPEATSSNNSYPFPTTTTTTTTTTTSSALPPSSPSTSDHTGPTPTARRIVDLVSHHTSMLTGTTDKAVLDVFNGEVGLRLFASLCKHLKRQRISTAGAMPLIADMRLYADLVQSRLRNPLLLPYFAALRELSQIFLVDARHARDLAAVIADADRFAGVFRAEEVYEYAQRRADWYQVRRGVEKAMYGMDCCLM